MVHLFLCQEKYLFQSYYLQFNNLNKEIVDLNIIYTEFFKEYTNIEKKIKSKEFTDMMHGDYKFDIEVNSLEIMFKDYKDDVDGKIEKISFYQKIFYELKKNFNNFEKKLSFILNSIHFLGGAEKSKFKSTKTVYNIEKIKEFIPTENDWDKNSSKIFFLFFVLEYFFKNFVIFFLWKIFYFLF